MVLPRSKGCRICVQRRVRCDLTRPICKNCAKGNRPCPGYDADLRIHDEGSKLRKRFGQHNESLSKTDVDTSSPATSTSSNSQSTDPLTDEMEVVAQVPSSDWQTSTDFNSSNATFGMFQYEFSPDAQLPLRPAATATAMATTSNSLLAGGSINFDKSLAVTVDHGVVSPYLLQEQLLHTFCSGITSQGTSILPPAMQNHSRWLTQLPDHFGSQLLDSAVRAVSMIHIAQTNNSEVFAHESRQFYGAALRLLNKTLTDQSKGMATETLSATVLLSFYEMFASDSNLGWISHAGGAGMLMRLRGPQRHRHGLDRDVYLAYRHTIMIDAFQRDEECFLAQPEWLQMAREVHEDLRADGVSPERLDLFDLAEEFYREYVTIPATFRDARRLPIAAAKMGPKKFRVHVTKVLDRTRQHRYTIKSIHVRFRDALRRSGLEPSSHMTTDHVFPQQYTYQNVFIASTNVGYWTILILLNIVLKEADNEFHPEKTGLYIMENRDIAQDVCRATPFMLTSSFLGPFFITFALRLCLMIFDPGAERTWVVNRLLEIGATRMKMASDIPGFDSSMSVQHLAETRAAETFERASQYRARTSVAQTVE
ncbi:hypothetical protein PV10_04001 [Exophiala mesophila]|uniref:Zn(2)-C6 fungal-type domain-containing protein n=1 Tax=Exophiala mesophila TaxID=212818 RepID=A0A0D1WU19_EXOME|nr:uncharacterized protein PV10_04001 [Exophiala mesophila]KIV92730.1 hypothetical protein PV10_04001 [Exophiala mesophila]